MSEGARLGRTGALESEPHTRAEARSIRYVVRYVTYGVIFRLRELGPFSRSRAYYVIAVVKAANVSTSFARRYRSSKSRKKGARAPRPRDCVELSGLSAFEKIPPEADEREGRGKGVGRESSCSAKNQVALPRIVIFEENGGEITERNREAGVE